MRGWYQRPVFQIANVCFPWIVSYERADSKKDCRRETVPEKKQSLFYRQHKGLVASSFSSLQLSSCLSRVLEINFIASSAAVIFEWVRRGRHGSGTLAKNKL